MKTVKSVLAIIILIAIFVGYWYGCGFISTKICMFLDTTFNVSINPIIFVILFFAILFGGLHLLVVLLDHKNNKKTG